MTRLPPLTYRDVITRLRQAGFVFDRQAKGSHEIWYNPATHRRTTVPNHPGTIPGARCTPLSEKPGFLWMSFCAESTAICLIDFTSPADAVRHDRMVALVERTAEGVDLQKSSRPRGRRMLRPCCNATPKADALVHELYGLTAEEIAVVEGK